MNLQQQLAFFFRLNDLDLTFLSHVLFSCSCFHLSSFNTLILRSFSPSPQPSLPLFIHPSIHASASLVLGPFIIVVLMHADPDCYSYFQPPLPLACTPTSSPLPFCFGGDLCTAAFSEGQLRAGLAVFPLIASICFWSLFSCLSSRPREVKQHNASHGEAIKMELSV